MKTKIFTGCAILGWILMGALAGWGQDKPVSLVDSGIEHYKAGRYQESLRVLKEVIRTSIDDRELFLAYLYTSYTYFSLPVQELGKAKAQAEKAVAINPDSVLREDEFVSEFVEFYKKIREEMTGIGYFDADPNPANIYLDNAPIGVAPIKKELLAKVYLLRAVKWGYTPYEGEIEIKKTEVTNFKIPLNDDKNWKTFIRSSVIFVVLSYLMKTI